MELQALGQQVQDPQETLRKMYDKLVTPQLARRGAYVPLPTDQTVDPKEGKEAKNREGEKGKGQEVEDKGQEEEAEEEAHKEEEEEEEGNEEGQVFVIVHFFFKQHGAHRRE